jgi:probable HAF family extracellular repeat protein
MKSRISMRLIAIAALVTLTISGSLAAQDATVPAKKAQHHHYKLIDVGTFGGPASFFNLPGNSVPALNSRNFAVGDSATSTPVPPNGNCFFCEGLFGFIPFVYHAFEVQKGVVTDLGSLPPESLNSSIAQAVSPSGDTIVGGSENGVIDPVLSDITEIHAVVWRQGQIIDLGTLGGNQSAAFAVNDRGQVAGFALNAVPDPFSMFYQAFSSSNGTQTRAFLWDKNNGMQDLGTLGGNDALALFLNQRGQVAGTSYTNSTPNTTTGLPTQDPFLWDGKTMLDLGTLGGTNGGPTALNNRGQVIGLSNLSGDQSSHPFLWDQGKLIDLYANTVGGNPITANGINDAGEIVGAAAFSTQPHDAYLWQDAVATDLGHLDGDCFSEAWAMNSAKQIAVFSMSCDGTKGRAALWHKGSLVDLNTLIPVGSSLRLVWPMAINDRGEIAGIGVPSGCSGPWDPAIDICGHAFLLIPCDDDHRDIEGCDYSMVEAKTAATAVSRTPAATIAGPLGQDNAGFGVAANPMLRRFGTRFWPLNRQPVPPAPRKE